MKRVLKWALLLSIVVFLIDKAVVASYRSKNNLCRCGGPIVGDPYEYYSRCTKCGRFQ